MRILVVSHEFPPIGGGGANACFHLTRGFAGEGHDVTVLTCNYENMSQNEVIDGVEIIRLNAKRKHKEYCGFMEMLSFLRMALVEADRLQKKAPYDICQIFFGIPSGPVGYYLKKKYGLPYVVRFGGGDVPGFQKRFTQVYKLIAPFIKIIWKNADALIMNSEGLLEMAKEFYDKVSFDIIHNGVDQKFFSPQPAKKDRNVIRILFASRLIERKGLQFIVPQIRDVANKVSLPIKVVVVGDGPYRETIEELCDKHDVKEFFEFVGTKNRNEIREYYQEAELFILPSSKEGMPNVVLEAMACGLPILMTPCEGSKELIKDNGYIIEVEQFGDKLVELINNEEIRKRMALQSRAMIEKEFGWDNIIAAYLAKYESLGRRE